MSETALSEEFLRRIKDAWANPKVIGPCNRFGCKGEIREVVIHTLPHLPTYNHHRCTECSYRRNFDDNPGAWWS